MTGDPAPGIAPRLAARRPAELAGERFDLVVVGAGITGAGVARHAAHVGLRTLVLDASDFAAGTSSRSTKLIHGGLRYLAMGDFALVRESALERKSLRAMAPHLAEPRWMLVPARSRLELVKLRVGIGLYERLGAVAPEERHRNWSARDLAAGEPLLDRQRLPWACVYREYLTDDARLVLAALRAAAARGAEACNYARVLAVTRGAAGCRLRVLDGLNGVEVDIDARAVVNAAGPWVEALLGGGTARRLHLSKGVHLVLARQRLPVQHLVMMTAADGRPVFAIPQGDVTYVGTTDTSYHGPPDLWPEVLPGDIDYLLATVNGHFDLPPLSADDVLATWAGLRPLIHQPGKAPKEMSRRDEIWRDGALISIAGGKLTGFRRMAEDVMAVVGEVLGRDVTIPEPLAPLAGGDVADAVGLAAEVARRYQLRAQAAVRLVRLYGSEVFAVLGDAPTPASASTFLEELRWGMDVEGAASIEDLVYRRLRAAWFLPDELDDVLAATVEFVTRRGWDAGRARAEVAGVRGRLAAELAFRSPPPAYSAVSGASR